MKRSVDPPREDRAPITITRRALPRRDAILAQYCGNKGIWRKSSCAHGIFLHCKQSFRGDERRKFASGSSCTSLADLMNSLVLSPPPLVQSCKRASAADSDLASSLSRFPPPACPLVERRIPSASLSLSLSFSHRSHAARPPHTNRITPLAPADDIGIVSRYCARDHSRIGPDGERARARARAPIMLVREMPGDRASREARLIHDVDRRLYAAPSPSTYTPSPIILVLASATPESPRVCSRMHIQALHRARARARALLLNTSRFRAANAFMRVYPSAAAIPNRQTRH